MWTHRQTVQEVYYFFNNLLTYLRVQTHYTHTHTDMLEHTHEHPMHPVSYILYVPVQRPPPRPLQIHRLILDSPRGVRDSGFAVILLVLRLAESIVHIINQLLLSPWYQFWSSRIFFSYAFLFLLFLFSMFFLFYISIIISIILFMCLAAYLSFPLSLRTCRLHFLEH